MRIQNSTWPFSKPVRLTAGPTWKTPQPKFAGFGEISMLWLSSPGAKVALVRGLCVAGRKVFDLEGRYAGTIVGALILQIITAMSTSTMRFTSWRTSVWPRRPSRSWTKSTVMSARRR